MPIGVIISITTYSCIVIGSFFYGWCKPEKKLSSYNKECGEFKKYPVGETLIRTCHKYKELKEPIK